MNIEMKFEKGFDNLFERMKRDYPKEIFDIDGIGNQLDIVGFTDKFFDENMSTTSDVSIDANANVDDTSVIAYDHEVGKPLKRLNSYYALWREICKMEGEERANEVIEKQLSGDYYINDFHGVGGSLPYSYYGKTVLPMKVNGDIKYETIENFFDEFIEDDKFEKKSYIDYTEVTLNNVSILDENNKWTDVSRILRHPSHTNLVGIETAGGRCTLVTEDHPVIMKDGYEKYAKDVQIGEYVKLSDSSVLIWDEDSFNDRDDLAGNLGFQTVNQDTSIPMNILSWDKKTIKRYLNALFQANAVIDEETGDILILFERFDLAQMTAELVRWSSDDNEAMTTFLLDRDKYYLVVCKTTDPDLLYNCKQEKIEGYNLTFDKDNPDRVVKVFKVESPTFVYDITTESGHFHCQGLIQHNCFNYSMYDIMAQGLPMINKIKCVPPKHLLSYKSQAEQFTVIAANSTLGAERVYKMWLPCR